MLKEIIDELGLATKDDLKKLKQELKWIYISLLDL